MKIEGGQLPPLDPPSYAHGTKVQSTSINKLALISLHQGFEFLVSANYPSA